MEAAVTEGIGAPISFAATLKHRSTGVPDAFRRSAVFVHKILQGSKPADLPLEQLTKFELVINLRTAKRST